MKIVEKYNLLIEHFNLHLPDAETELNYKNEYELLIAVVLSAQCTDKRVNIVTPKLFEHFPSFEKLSQATFDEVFQLIKSISYPNNKSKYIIATANIVVHQYNNILPHTVEELITLPGVGRKTANVITSVLFNQPNMAVDTHVFRVSHRLGLVKKAATTPLAVEKELIKYFPKELVHKAHHWLILHGRYICTAKKPQCIQCQLIHICNYKKNTAPITSSLLREK